MKCESLGDQKSKTFCCNGVWFLLNLRLMSDSIFFILSNCCNNNNNNNNNNNDDDNNNNNNNNNNYNKLKDIISQALDSTFKEKAIKYSQNWAKIKLGSLNTSKKIFFFVSK